MIHPIPDSQQLLQRHNHSNTQATTTQARLLEPNETCRQNKLPDNYKHLDPVHQKTTISDSQDSSTDSKQSKETASMVEVNHNHLDFGLSPLFPGSVEELNVKIKLKDQALCSQRQSSHVLRVFARCLNKEFDELDEYIFSVRSRERFEYFEEMRFKIKPQQCANLIIAVKMPPITQNIAIKGELILQFADYKPLKLPITANCTVPEINCAKKLYKTAQKTSFIRISARQNQPKMAPISFKNMSSHNLVLEVSLLSGDSASDHPFEVAVQSMVTCRANQPFLVNFQLRQNIGYEGAMPVRTFLRKILLLKIRGSSVHYNFPIEVQISKDTA